jgi:hypothetical protein
VLGQVYVGEGECWRRDFLTMERQESMEMDRQDSLSMGGFDAHDVSGVAMLVNVFPVARRASRRPRYCPRV